MEEYSLPEFNGYRTISVLGEGASSIVLLASDATGRKFAIKTLRPELSADASMIQMLEDEAGSLTQINHPRVAQIVSFSTELDPLPHIITEYVEGKSLKEMVSDSPVSGPLLLSLAQGLLEGLEAIHKAGVIHKDLKPANIVFTEDGVKLIDFGISRSSTETTFLDTDRLAATPGWLSPEQAKGINLGIETDIFNFGIVLAYASTGKHPFGEGSPDALLYKISNSPPQLSELPSWLKVIVGACLEKEPSKRPSTEQLKKWLNRPGSTSDQEEVLSDSTTVASSTFLSGSVRDEIVQPSSVRQKLIRTTNKEGPGRTLGWRSITAIIASVAIISGILVASNLPGRGMVVVRVNSMASTENPVRGQGYILVEGPGWSEEVEFGGDRVKTLDGDWISNREMSVTFTPSFSDDESYSQSFYPEDFGASLLGTGQKLVIEAFLLSDKTVFAIKVFKFDGLVPVVDIAIREELFRGNEAKEAGLTMSARNSCVGTETESLKEDFKNTLALRARIDSSQEKANLDIIDDNEPTTLLYTTWEYRFRQFRNYLDAQFEKSIVERPYASDPLYEVWQDVHYKFIDFREAVDDLRFAAAIESSSRWDDGWDPFYSTRREAKNEVSLFESDLESRSREICEIRHPIRR